MRYAIAPGQRDTVFCIVTRQQALALFVSVLVAGACASCARSENELLDKPGGRIRVAYTSTPDLNDVPSLMAHRRLGDRGYSVDTVFFAQPELAAHALARGDVDIAIGSTRTFWASALDGAPIVAVMEASRNDHLVVANAPIRSCAELGGRRVAFHSAGSVGEALLRAYVAEQCPGTEPLYVQIPGSSSRLSALRAGAIDAAVVQHDDLLRGGLVGSQNHGARDVRHAMAGHRDDGGIRQDRLRPGQPARRRRLPSRVLVHRQEQRARPVSTGRRRRRGCSRRLTISARS